MKATYAEVKDLINRTLWESGAFTKSDQPHIDELGYFAPSGANWRYCIGIARSGGSTYLVVTQFGEVLGFRKLYI
jgi:hypothetical protein